MENGHHYLEADIKVLKPESAGGHEISVINFDPNNANSDVAVSNKTAVSRIDAASSSSGYSTVDYYDIKLGGAVTSIADPSSFSVVLPEWVGKQKVENGKTRVFDVITYHNGEVRVLPAYVEGDNLTFESKDFSVFTIVYKDVVKPAENSIVYIPKKPVVNTSAK